MIKKTKPISINILSVLTILMCLLLSVVGITNSWFSDSHEQGVLIEVEVGDLRLKLYQNSISTDSTNEIFSNATNTEYETDKNEDGSLNTKTNSQYVALSTEIQPDTLVPLKLILANKDAGSASMYVRYKFELYTREVAVSGEGVTIKNSKIEGVTISGFDAASSSITGYDTALSDDEKKDGALTESQNGFVYNSEDGYYYYQKPQTATEFTTGSNALFEKGEVEILLTHFMVPYSAFINTDGSLKIINSDTIYIKLIVQADISPTFTNV